MIESIYLAGSSDEVGRAAYWKERLIGVGFEVTSSWPEAVRAAGTANPDDSDTRWTLAQNCKSELFGSDFLWVLVPIDAPGRGAYYEAGYADAHHIETVFSGTTKQSIFCSQGQEFTTDDEAFSYICALKDLR